MRDGSRTRPMLRAGLAVMLLTSCSAPGVSETERAICRELRRDLPTWSRADTPETLESGARFIRVFEAVCQ